MTDKKLNQCRHFELAILADSLLLEKYFHCFCQCALANKLTEKVPKQLKLGKLELATLLDNFIGKANIRL